MDPCPKTSTQCVAENDDYFCDCITGFQLKQGEDRKNNKGECEKTTKCNEGTDPCPKPSTLCIATEDDFFCDCITGFQLKPPEKQRETNKGACEKTTKCNEGTDPCPKTSTQCVASEEDYFCECITGFQLKTTDKREKNKGECEKTTICNNGTDPCPKTSTQCIAENDDYFCDCITGFQLKQGEDRKNNKGECEKIELCTPNPCKNGGICVSAGIDYECQCIPGVTGKNCSDCSNLCGNVTCEFEEISQTIYCKCEDASKFFDKKTKICEDIDKCIQMLLDGKCNGNYETCKDGKCDCEDNYSYQNGTTTCIADFCKNEKENCKDNEKCIELNNGGAMCICKEGFFPTENGCEEQDKCALIFPKCDQKCNKGNCSCGDEFVLQDDGYSCKVKSSNNECTIKKKCFPGQCIKYGKEEECYCPEATHVAKDDKCIDRCTANELPFLICPDDKCEPDKKLGFKCTCEGKYQLSKNGIYCERKFMCSEEEIRQQCARQNARCVEAPEEVVGYICKCDDGYELFNNHCISKCEIPHNFEGCLGQKAVCALDEEFLPICKCLPLLDKDAKGNCVKAKYSFTGNFTVPSRSYEGNPRMYSRRTKRSIAAVDYIKLNTDFKKSLDFVYGEKYTDFIVLGCRTEEDNFVCDLELKFGKDPVKEKILNAIVAPSTCVPVQNSQYCTVYPSLVMKKTTKEVFTPSDPCEERVKNNLCGPTTVCVKTDGKNVKKDGNQFNCTCSVGYNTKQYYQPFDNEASYIHNCEDINECLKPFSCPKNTTCSNTPGSYDCLCEFGFRNTSQNIKIDGCKPVCEENPCGPHGNCEQKGSHDFACACDGSFKGPYCNVTNEVLEHAKKTGAKNVAITGGVLGALLAIVLVIGFFIFRRKKKTVSDDDEYARHRQRAAGRARPVELRQRDGDFEHRSLERHFSRQSPERRQSGDYRQFRDSEGHIIPRAQLMQSSARPLPELRNEQRKINDEERVSGKRNLGHSSDEDARRSNMNSNQRSLGWSSDQLNKEGRGVKVMEYKNRGYEDD